jgi:hypothetical protein
MCFCNCSQRSQLANTSICKYITSQHHACAIQSHAWDKLSETNSDIATGEAARRYYSAKEFIINGASNVFLPRLPPKIDSKFFDNFIVPNIWYRYDNSRLKETIKTSIKFPIATSLDKKEPRLLAISVDVEEGETVTFDSYVKEKETNTRKSEYGDYKPGDNGKKGEHERTIKYEKGIMAEHIMASASVPEHYDYTLVPKEYDYTKTEEEEKSMDIQNNDLKKYSRFWDGGVLSHRTGERRTYHDLLDKRFEITKVIRIERSVDKDDIANKWCDFSLGTISDLFNQGIKDALKTLQGK